MRRRQNPTPRGQYPVQTLGQSVPTRLEAQFGLVACRCAKYLATPCVAMTTCCRPQADIRPSGLSITSIQRESFFCGGVNCDAAVTDATAHELTDLDPGEQAYEQLTGACAGLGQEAGRDSGNDRDRAPVCMQPRAKSSAPHLFLGGEAPPQAAGNLLFSSRSSCGHWRMGRGSTGHANGQPLAQVLSCLVHIGHHMSNLHCQYYMKPQRLRSDTPIGWSDLSYMRPNHASHYVLRSS
jgi:hypothetical protein